MDFSKTTDTELQNLRLPKSPHWFAVTRLSDNRLNELMRELDPDTLRDIRVSLSQRLPLEHTKNLGGYQKDGDDECLAKQGGIEY